MKQKWLLDLLGFAFAEKTKQKIQIMVYVSEKTLYVIFLCSESEKCGN